MPESDADAARVAVNPFAERVQIGARIEKRMVKVLKGLAEYLDMSLGDLLEGIVLHAFESKPPFSAETLRRIQQRAEGLERVIRLARGPVPVEQPELARVPRKVIGCVERAVLRRAPTGAGLTTEPTTSLTSTMGHVMG